MNEKHIRELVGEILIAGFDGQTMTAHAQDLIQSHHVRNFILFSRNVASISQLQALTSELQNATKRTKFPYPAIICTDQENGIVRRVAPGLPGLPGQMAVGATGEPKNAYRIGLATGEQLRALGINMNLAPVLDVNSNPDNPVIGVRSFGENPHVVADFGVQMIAGLQSSGVIACGKHFPGHGDTSVDSHLALPQILHDELRLFEVELVPFQRAIHGSIDAMMTAHILFPAMEPEPLPATLSPKVITQLLRQKLQFTGVVLTDCLEMDAISKGIGIGEGAILALLAGADMILVSHHYERQVAAIEAIVKAVTTGEIPVVRLAEAANRVRLLRKNRIRFLSSKSKSMDVIVEESLLLQREISSKAVTVVADKSRALPMNQADIRSVHVLVDEVSPHLSAADAPYPSTLLSESFSHAVSSAKVQLFSFDENKVDAEFVANLFRSDLLVVGINGVSHASYNSFVNELLRRQKQKQICVFALQSPYDFTNLHGVDLGIALYEYTPWMVEAGIQALFGKRPLGQLPVTIAKS